MKFLQRLIEDDDHDIFDDLLDDLSAQEAMAAIRRRREAGVSWDGIAASKEEIEDEAMTDLTDEEWGALIRVLKAGGRAAKMIGLKEEATPMGQARVAMLDARADIELIIELLQKEILVSSHEGGDTSKIASDLGKTAKGLREALAATRPS